MKGIAAILMLALVAPAAYCETNVYRWVDAEGKVHYGDRPPADQTAEDISDTVKQVNEDTSSEERDKLNKVFAEESEGERQVREQEARQQAQQQQRQQRQCDQARRQLRILREERFVLADPDGTTHDIKESERGPLVERLEADIRRHCG